MAIEQTKIIKYIQRQVTEFREGGQVVVKRKIRRGLSELVFFVFLPICLFDTNIIR